MKKENYTRTKHSVRKGTSDFIFINQPVIFFTTMAREIITIILFMLLLPAVEAKAGYEAVVLQTYRFEQYDKAVRGFQKACHCKSRRLYLHELQDVNIINKIKSMKPDILLVIGPEALYEIKGIRKIPVVYIMILDPVTEFPNLYDNVTGVNINIDQEDQLEIITSALPDVKRIGMLYDPAKTGRIAGKAQQAANKMGVRLVMKEVYDSKKVMSLIQDMDNNIDAFLLQPDITVITPETVRFLFLFSMQTMIPVISFSEMYAREGALMSVSVDPFDIGCQAGELGARILSGEKVSEVKPVSPRKTVITINKAVERNLELHVHEKIMKKARKIIKGKIVEP